jgi:cell wall-associated NlpC family hydrolase
MKEEALDSGVRDDSRGTTQCVAYAGLMKRRVTRKQGARLWVALLLLVWGGCATKPPIPPEASKALPGKAVPRMGYSIQVGAFTNADNAIRLTESLEKQGMSAYYFHHKSGLFKVRFGDYPTREAALIKAEALVQTGVFSEYYIVSPEDYALARLRLYGEATVRNEIVETAEGFVGLSYQWGGSSAEEGFDCSGLTMAVYQLNGLNLPRSSREQYSIGDAVERSELAKGDLVFFATKGRKTVSHVGVYAGDDRFIHAPGRGKTVRVDSLSDRYYLTRYVGARKYL